MQKPSNPIKYFINNRELKEFTFSPGNMPYYVLIRSHGHILFSALVMANNADHCINLLIKALQHRRECCLEYKDSAGTIEKDPYKYDTLIHRLHRDELIPDDPNDYSVFINPVEANHFFKVGWDNKDISFY